MHYVYLTNNVVTDQAQVNPSTIFYPEYASQFIEAPDEVTFGWALENDVWVAPPAPDIQTQNKNTATTLLQQTDWVELPSVSNTSITPHLVNVNELISYRAAVRAIAVNPPNTPATFPNKPQEVWSN